MTVYLISVAIKWLLALAVLAMDPQFQLRANAKQTSTTVVDSA